MSASAAMLEAKVLWWLLDGVPKPIKEFAGFWS